MIDDLLVYRKGQEEFQIVVNASNADKDWAWMNAVNSGEVLMDRARPDLRVLRPATLRNLKDPSSGPDMRVDLALQGPASMRILQCLAGGTCVCGPSRPREARPASCSVSWEPAEMGLTS